MGQWSPYIRKFEAEYNLPPGLLGQVMRQESGGQAHVVSRAGAIGLMQLMPGTASSLGVDPHDPIQNLKGGAKYLSQQLKRFGTVPKALAAYNAGPGAVQQYNGVPPYKETQNYVKRITGEWNKVRPSRPASRVDHVNASHNRVDTSGLNRQMRNAENALNELNQWGAAGSFFDGERARLGGRVSSLGSEISQMNAMQQATPQQSNAPRPGVQVNNLGVPGKNPFKFWENKFGLKRSSSDNDAPGAHVDGSYHYQPAEWGGVRGYDYGDASNDPKKFMQIGQAIKNNPNLAKNIGEAFYDPWGFYVDNGKIIKGSIGGHGDHLHLGYQ